jgi:pimeloyl-ACP methyl ester carboxylesterase
MALPALVLVHGGQCAADCWDPTVDEIRRQAPELTVLAVDLPGRRGKPGDLTGARINNWVESVVTDIETAGIDSLVIVAHSMGGLIVPGVVGKLGPSRVREMIFAAAYVPPNGSALVDTFPGLLGWYARSSAKRNELKGKSGTMPTAWAKFVFCNGMKRAQRDFAVDRFYPESPCIVLDHVDRTDMPDDVPRTWILTRRDRALPVKSQRRSIDAIGGVQTIIEMDTSHMLMITEPERLAEILVDRCRLYSR